MGAENTSSWIFVSHSSRDLTRVREIRNYLEGKGAGPLLFHLLALDDPEEFWPLIEREIRARNFFLHCDSSSAKDSEWVQREQKLVEIISQERPVRIGSVNVEAANLDTKGLDDFLEHTRVYPSFARGDGDVVQPYLDQLERSGFKVFVEETINHGESLSDMLDAGIQPASKEGWIVVFVSRASSDSSWVKHEISEAKKYAGKILPVLIDDVKLPGELNKMFAFDGTADVASAPLDLARVLLTNEGTVWRAGI